MAPLREAALPAANKIFVDREAPQRVFEKAAFSIPHDRAAVCVFHGVGGQGKTALCRELIRKTDGSLEPSYGFLRRALLDLHARPKTDPDLLLVWIRNAFADAGLFMPCFDLALALMWQGTRGEEVFPVLTRPWLARGTKTAQGAVGYGATEIQHLLGSDTATELLSHAVGHIPAVGFIVKRLGGWIIDKSKRAYLERSREPLQKLYRDGGLRPAYELSSLLPWMLAQDLNYHLSRNPTDRFVLFIDEYERVFDQAGAGARWVENPFDAHMRGLIKETNGLLAVFFARERLPWGDHPEWRDDLKGNQHLLGGLADKDADDFLKQIPIADEAVRKTIIDGARERPDSSAGVYPLMLDLQVEHWRALATNGEAAPHNFTVTAETFESRCIEIVERVLRDYDVGLQITIARLSVARRFDRAAFNHVVTTFGTGLPLDNFDRIVDLSFVTRADDGFLSLHNVVAAAIRANLTDDIKRTSLAALFDHFCARAHCDSHFDLTPEKVAALFEASQLRQAQDVAGFVGWLSQAAEPLRTAALYAPAASLWRGALGTVEKALGAEHPATGTSLNNLAGLLEAQGDYAAAKPLYERALAIREKALGAEHPATGASLNNLAVLLEAQGDYAAAKPLYERALAIREKALGAEHPATARASITSRVCFRLRATMRRRSRFTSARWRSARRRWEPSIPIRARASTTSRVCWRLRATMRRRSRFTSGRWRSARRRWEPSIRNGHEPQQPRGSASGSGRLCGGEAALRAGAGDPREGAGSRASRYGREPQQPRGSASGSGRLCGGEAALRAGAGDQREGAGSRASRYGHEPQQPRGSAGGSGRLCGGEAALRARAGDQREGAGSRASGTGASLNNLAGLLQAQGDYAAAKPLYERALAISEKALGAEHPDTGTSLNNLAGLLEAQGDYAAAKPLYERALAISEKALGAEHPDTGASLNNLAGLLQAQGDYAAAKPLYERALAISEKALGAEHPLTKIIRENLKRNG